jgi:hypothetical protein
MAVELLTDEQQILNGKPRGMVGTKLEWVLTPIAETQVICADDFSLLSAFAVASGADKSTKIKINKLDLKQRGKALGMLLAGNGLDGVDGTFARLQKKLGTYFRRFPDAISGELVDTGGDRVQEFLMGNARMHHAIARGSDIGEKMALAATFTNGASSMARAFRQALELPSEENGHNILGFIGSRFGRAIVSTTANVVPEVQPALDGVSTVANIYNTADRLLSICKDFENGRTLSKEAGLKGKERLAFLAGTYVIGVAATLIHRKILHARKATETKTDIVQELPLAA